MREANSALCAYGCPAGLAIQKRCALEKGKGKGRERLRVKELLEEVDRGGGRLGRLFEKALLLRGGLKRLCPALPYALQNTAAATTRFPQHGASLAIRLQSENPTAGLDLRSVSTGLASSGHFVAPAPPPTPS